MTVASQSTTDDATTAPVWVSDGSDGLGRAGAPAARPQRSTASSGTDRRHATSSSASAPPMPTPGPAVGRASPRVSAAVLDRAAEATHLVLVSSAMVYGAWANNPVPLTEDAVLRPDVEFVYARQLGVGRAAGRRVAAAPSPVARSRCCGPSSAMAADGTSRAGRGAGRRAWASASARTTRRRSSCTSTTSPSAVVLAAEQRLDGVFNVAPDGWVAGERGACPGGCGAAPAAARPASPRSSATCAGGSSAARSRPVCAATPAGRGWWPTTG